MGVLSDLVIAPAGAAEEIIANLCPSDSWQGFSFGGMDNVKLATLLSLLSSNSPDKDYEKWLDSISPAAKPDDEGPWVYAFSPEATTLLAGIASKETDELDQLAKRWGETEEFEGWQEEDVNELLCSVGDLAESATLEKMTLFLWMSL